MFKSRLKLLTTLGSICCLVAFTSQAQNREGSVIFNTCAACHLPSGEGIPGAFPSLVELPDTYAKPGGKTYLISVILQGLNGPIQSKGNSYNGFMQPFAQTLTDQEIAAVLNHVLTKIAKTPLADITPITAEDVTQIRTQIELKQLPASHALRQQLFK